MAPNSEGLALLGCNDKWLVKEGSGVTNAMDGYKADTLTSQRGTRSELEGTSNRAGEAKRALDGKGLVLLPCKGKRSAKEGSNPSCRPKHRRHLRTIERNSVQAEKGPRWSMTQVGWAKRAPESKGDPDGLRARAC
jgi:hypothetical protein